MLTAGAAVQFRLENHGLSRIEPGPPRSEQGRLRRAEISDNRCRGARGQMHRAAVGTDKQRRPADQFANLDEIQAAGQGEESRRVQAFGDPDLSRQVVFSADGDDEHPGNFQETGGQGGRIFFAPIPEGVTGADMKNDEGKRPAAPPGSIGGDDGGECVDSGDFLHPGGRKGKGRNILFPEIHAQSPDQPGMGFDGVNGDIDSAPGSGLVVEKTLGFDGVTDFQPGAPEERDPGRPRAAVKIQKNVEPLFPDRPDEPDEIAALLFGRDDDDPVDVGMPLDQAAVRFFDEIGQGSLRETALEEGNGRGRQDDVAEPAETQEKNGSGIQFTF